MTEQTTQEQAPMTEQTDPLPAPGAPHAYVAVQRTYSECADRPEWDRCAVVIPEWDTATIDRARRSGQALLPIGPDGDTGTRWVTEEPAPSVEIEGRTALDDLLIGARIDALATDETVDVILAAGWRPPARVIETVEELDTLAEGVVVLDARQIVQEVDLVNEVGTYRACWWITPGSEFSRPSEAVALPAIVLHVPTEAGR